jgi:hypothetical protein
MSHTSEFGEFYVIHNGDWSGDVQITVRDGKDEATGAPRYKHVASLPYWLVERIVVAKVRQERIAAIEQAGPDELLGLKNTGPVMD